MSTLTDAELIDGLKLISDEYYFAGKAISRIASLSAQVKSLRKALTKQWEAAHIQVADAARNALIVEGKWEEVDEEFPYIGLQQKGYEYKRVIYRRERRP